MTGYAILWGMRARLLWRLLLVSRLILALGVIIWAVIVVSLTRQLARDNAISVSAGCDYLHEGITVLAAQSPSRHGALLAAKTAGYSHVIIDGTLVQTDRVAAPGPPPRIVADTRTSRQTPDPVPGGPAHARE